MPEETTWKQSQSLPQDAVEQLQDLLAVHPLQADDLAYDDDGASIISGASEDWVEGLNANVINYKYENGRRYHAFHEGAYLVPNDDEEQERMDLGHHIYRLILGGKLHLAPITNPQRILDLGTGTGIWAIDMADEYPDAEVLGTDLSPIQPQWTPVNCKFEVDDFESEWVYHKPFDFIHSRELGGCITDNELLFHQAFQNLTSGGYLEMQAVYPVFVSDDDTADKATHAQSWMETICEGSKRFGKPLDSALEWEDKMRRVGFVDVRREVHKLPIGEWPKDPKLKEIGKFQAVQEDRLVESYTPALFSRVLGWNAAEIQVFMAKVKEDLRNPSIHIYLPVYFVWARKP